jgi:hypothetical protein
LFIYDYSYVFVQLMKENENATTPPPQQKMERLHSLKEEHKNALERAKTLEVPHAIDISEEENHEGPCPAPSSDANSDTTSEAKSAGRTSWDELVDKLFTRDEDGKLIVNRDMVEKEVAIE